MIYFFVLCFIGLCRIFWEVATAGIPRDPPKPKEEEKIEEFPDYKYNRRKQEPDIDISKAFK